MNLNKLDQYILKTLTVLYVEDDLDTREQFSEFLRHQFSQPISNESPLACFFPQTPLSR